MAHFPLSFIVQAICFFKKWYPSIALLCIIHYAFNFGLNIFSITSGYLFMVCCCVALVVSDSVRPHKWQPTRFSVPGILQARTLEWVAISFSNA